MSRAVNLGLPEADIQAQCEARGICISSIEPLRSGGTHLVCVTAAGADEIRSTFRDHIIDGAVKRFPFYRAGDQS